MFNFVAVVKFGRALQNPLCTYTSILRGGELVGGSSTFSGAKNVARVFGEENVFICRETTYKKLYGKRR